RPGLWPRAPHPAIRPGRPGGTQGTQGARRILGRPLLGLWPPLGSSLRILPRRLRRRPERARLQALPHPLRLVAATLSTAPIGAYSAFRAKRARSVAWKKLKLSSEIKVIRVSPLSSLT